MFSSHAGAAAAQAPTYIANAVYFDGTVDLTVTTGLTGMADGPAGTLSFWMDLRGGDGTEMRLITNTGNSFRVQRLAANTIQVEGWDASSNKVRLLSTGTYTSAGTNWLHVYAYWNVNSPVGDMLINGVSDATPSFAAGNILYNRPDWTIGANIGGANKLIADVADVWFNPTNLGAAGLSQFRSAGGKPVDLGANGENPTGSSPIIFLSGATGTWHTNKGTGGGFTENGTLQDGASSPSD